MTQANVNMTQASITLVTRMWSDNPKLRPEPAEVLFQLKALIDQQEKDASGLVPKASSNESLQDLRVTLARNLHELLRTFCASGGKLEEAADSISELFCDDCIGSFEDAVSVEQSERQQLIRQINRKRKLTKALYSHVPIPVLLPTRVDQHMNEAFAKYAGHDFVRAFLRLLVGASNAAVTYSFEFPPFLTGEDFVDTAGVQFLARVTYKVEAKVRWTARVAYARCQELNRPPHFSFAPKGDCVGTCDRDLELVWQPRHRGSRGCCAGKP